jgi:Cu/Ag efflux protein CusF
LSLFALISAISLGIAADAQLATATGHLASVDASARTLVVKVEEHPGETHDMTFTLDEKTKIVKDGAAIAARELNPGDSVTVTYRNADGKNVVVNIGVGSKPAS